MKFLLRLLVAALLVVATLPLHAQWTQQTITLRAGWNAVFLNVLPEPADCDSLFAGLPVESVWDFNPTVDSPQFVQDPSTLIPGLPNWLTWFPPASPQGGVRNLFQLRDARGYLIKIADGSAPISWTLTGRPSLRPLTWRPGGANLVGFRVGTSAPTFQTLFAGESGLAGQPVYTLGTAGAWQLVGSLATTRPESGRAYWVRCTAPARRTSTFEVDSGSRVGIEFRSGLNETSLKLRNTSGAARNYSMRLLPSATPPTGEPALAGAVPLEYWKASYSTIQIGWEPFPATLSFTAIPANGEQLVRLGMRRPAGVSPAAGSRYQGLLEVTDDLGSRWLVPLAAEGNVTIAAAGSGVRAAQAPVPLAGLWVGEAMIKNVSQPAHPSAPDQPSPAGGEFSFRLIVHVDAAGAARLLQQVFLVRKPATYLPDPDGPGGRIQDEPARVVLVTEQSLVRDFTGPGEISGRRISSTAFGFTQPLALVGGAFGTGSIGGAAVMDYNHARNPFKHVFHPDHDNRDERFEQVVAEGRESFTVSRNLSLQFSGTDPLSMNPPGWGETEVGGQYRESITGLHRRPVQISGTFRLVRVSKVAALNQ